MNPPTHIHPIRFGLTNCYLARQEGTLLIDCGDPRRQADFQRALDRLEIAPDEIDLILLTHGHSDHIGSTAEIARLTGAPVAIHAADAPYLAEGRQQPATPVGLWARLLGMIFKLGQARFRFTPYTPDIQLGDEDYPLDQFGLHGRVLHTPGHTAGSVTVLLEDKPRPNLFVGDLAMNGFPALRRSPQLSFVIDDREQLLQSWRRLLRIGTAMVYPAHGRPFEINALRGLGAQPAVKKVN